MAEKEATLVEDWKGEVMNDLKEEKMLLEALSLIYCSKKYC